MTAIHHRRRRNPIRATPWGLCPLLLLRGYTSRRGKQQCGIKKILCCSGPNILLPVGQNGTSRIRVELTGPQSSRGVSEPVAGFNSGHFSLRPCELYFSCMTPWCSTNIRRRECSDSASEVWKREVGGKDGSDKSRSGGHRSFKRVLLNLRNPAIVCEPAPRSQHMIIARHQTIIA